MFISPETVSVLALYAALNALVMLTLSYLVVTRRRVHGVAIGHGDVVELLRLQRAFGSAAENVPAGLLMLAALAGLEAPLDAIHLTGGLLTAGRVLHAWGLAHSADNSPPRTLGAFFTWLSYLSGGILLVALAFGVRLDG